jgi:hypothetical protein
MHVPAFVLARPRAASPAIEACLLGVGLVGHAALIDIPELAQPQAQLHAGVDGFRLASVVLVVRLVAQQAAAAHHPNHALMHPARNLLKRL